VKASDLDVFLREGEGTMLEYDATYLKG